MQKLNPEGTPDIDSRLDRLPITSKHRMVLVAMGIAYFFELGDINAFSFASPGMINQWHMSVSSVATVIGALFAGMFVGATGGGWVADRFGRKFALMAMTFLYGVSSLCTAFAWSIDVVTVGRFATGIGVGGIAVATTVYIAEIFPASVRGKYTAFAFTIGVIGIPITAGVARLVEPLVTWGWRLVFVWGSLGILDALLIGQFEESPRWLAVRGETERAHQAVVRLENVALAEHGALAAPVEMLRTVEYRKVPYRNPFRREYRGRMALFLSLWVLQTFGLYGFSAWVPTLLIKEGVSLPHTLTYATIMTIASPLGALLAMQLSERLDRKWLLVATAAILAIFGVSYGTAITPTVVLLCGFLVSFFLQFFAVILYTYTPEQFPTSIRSSGMGFNYGVGRLANVFGPFIVGALYTNLGYMSVFIYISGCWAAVALIAGFFGPTSRQVVTLENTEEPLSASPELVQ
jgi:MFS transporter, putative metabolite:H+ symporter